MIAKKTELHKPRGTWPAAVHRPLAFALAVLLAAAPLHAVEPNPALKLVVDVVQGADAEYDIHTPTEADISVRVADEAGTPVRNAVVVFQLPQSGPGGGFLNDSRFATVMTNEMGVGTARSFRPNRIPGEFNIMATVSYRDFQSVTLNIVQKNVDKTVTVSRSAPPVQAPKKSGGGKIIAIVALIGGAAAGAALGLAGGGGGGSSSPGPVTPPAGPAATINPGNPTFGAPR
jgi:hypothetical protein